MLAANLPVCHYPGMPGQNNSNNNVAGSNNNNNIVNNPNGVNNSGSSNNSNINNGSNCSSGGGGLVGGGTSAAAAKNQLEQLNTMREALFSQDGWGCQHVNQDTNWEVPSSPEPTNKDPSAPPLWKPTINNGTDLWESTLRNGGQPPSQAAQKTPWGHTPSSNLGGTWGEDDDGTDSSSVWTGTTNNPNTSTSVGVGGVNAPVVGNTSASTGQQWGQSNVGIGISSTGANSSTPTNNIPNVVAGTTTATGNGVPAGIGTGGTGGNSGNGWGDPRDIRSGALGAPIDIRGVDPRDPMRAASAGDPRDLRMLDPRDPIRGDPRGISGRLNGSSEMWGQHHAIAHNQLPGINKIVGQGGAAAVVAPGGVAGITAGVGGMNSAASVNVPVAAQWGGAQPVVGQKDMSTMVNKQVSGWEEPSPPPQRRTIPNYDDGTSLWGQQSRVPGGGSHWKDIPDPMNRNHLIRSAIGNQSGQNAGVVSGINVGNNSGSGLVNTQAGGIAVVGNPNNPMGTVGPQSRLQSSVGSTVVGQHKPENTMWVHPNNSNVNGRNPVSSWGDDGCHNVGNTSGTNWIEDKQNTGIGQIGAHTPNTNTWNETTNSWNKNQNKMTSGVPGWVTSSSNDPNELSSEWTAHGSVVGKPQQKLGGIGISGINGEIIKQSKQFRFLVEAGFKKEDVERALISANMNMEEAADMLRANPNISMDGWRRHDETLSSYTDHTNSTVGGGFPGRYSGASSQPSMTFPPNNLVNNMGGSTVGNAGNNPNLSALNTMQPLQQVQKYLNQGPHNITGGQQSVNPAVAFGQSNANLPASSVNITSSTNSQPSAQQLRMLVQQIQLAVHHGYLSSQILNQPLAPTTLVLLNQLLSNIKHLQGAQQSLARGNNSNNLQLNVAIAKHKQQIQTLQNQINAQQAHYIKQQQNIQQTPQTHPTSTHITNSSTDYLRGQHEAINALQTNFSDISLNKTSSSFQGAANQQSRLNQWKLPVLEKDDNAEFSRAPGTTKQNLSLNSSNNMGPLGLQSDGTWSAGRNISDGWPDASNENENKDWSVTPTSSATSYTDLVQEFEPGKPWKGSQMKSIEDDPSITPGSVARSPLSINPTPKDADIFANASKNSPTDLPALGLSSSTWSFNPSSANQSFPSWSDSQQQCQTSEIWSTQMNKTSRGPPPGLGSNKGGNISTSVSGVNNPPSVVGGNGNGWLVGGNGRGNSGWVGSNSTWNSNWLLLKNLTPQIDGSTLRTLCMQHGPPVSFHQYLNQGFALCKYATREEASKAQMTLNNCVLGNTTICAESPTENEVQNLLQHLPQNSQTHTSSVNGGSNGNNNGGSASITNSTNSINNVVGNSGVSNNSGAPGASINGPSANNGNNGQGQNSTSSASIVSSSGNTPTTTGNHNTWRQTSQNQQNQVRPTGREADFDYISKYVCSIVDD